MSHRVHIFNGLKNYFIRGLLINIGQEIKRLLEIVKELDKKVVTIFLSVAVLQTISWYFTSRRFFRANFFIQYQSNPDVYLIEYLYWFIGDFFTFFLLAVLVIKFVLKEKLSNYGFTKGDFKAGLNYSLLFLAVMLPLIWFFSATPQFTAKYPHLLSARSNWSRFFIYEAGMLIYMFSWEFIWRGFTLFGLKEKFGYYSIFMQMIPFVILHNGKPAPETFGAILGGLALGGLAYRTNSFYYGVITHIGVMYSIDLICTLRYRANDFGVGISSLLNLFRIIF